MNAFGFVFLAALVLASATRLWLAARHVSYVRAHAGRVPQEFAADISLDAHGKAAEYTVAKTCFASVGIVVDALVVLAFTFGGGLQWLSDLAAAWSGGSVTHGLALIALVAVISTAIDMPFNLYSVFGIEERFGFNKMTLKLYFTDFAKSALLAAVFGLPLTAAVLWLMERMGTYWWAYAWVLWMAFNLAMLALYPTWIAPLFNRF